MNDAEVSDWLLKAAALPEGIEVVRRVASECSVFDLTEITQSIVAEGTLSPWRLMNTISRP